MQTTRNPAAKGIKFRFKNLGPVKDAELELGDLTIIAGRNNTGKTYLAYTLYGFLQAWKHWPFAEEFFLGKGSSRAGTSKSEWDPGRAFREAIAEGQTRQSVSRGVLSQEREKVVRRLARDFSNSFLPQVFSSPREDFRGASIEVKLSDQFPETRTFRETHRSGVETSFQFDGSNFLLTCGKTQENSGPTIEVEDLADFYLQFLFPEFLELSTEQFVLTTERFGISLFYKELDFTKNRLVELLQKLGDEKDRRSLSPFLLIDSATSRYTIPIRDNIEFTRSISDIRKEKSEIFESKLFDDIRNMMNGYFSSKGDDINFKSRARKERSFDIPLHRASSSARGLSDLYFFLRHMAKENHLLIIDEPESHLDTANQILFARLIARMVRAGIKVLITTHSDYLIKEINNLVMLSHVFEDKSKVVKSLKYNDEDYLEPQSIRVYLAENNSLTLCTVDQYGVDIPAFDKTIEDINRVSIELSSRLVREGEE